MFYCIGKSNNLYKVLDTTDLIEEDVTKDELINYLNLGIQILGVTKESLTLNDKARLFLNLKSSHGKRGLLFNGFFFIEYNSDNYSDFNNPYINQIFDIDSRDELYNMLSLVQKCNSEILDKLSIYLSSSDINYSVVDVFDNGVFNVLDLTSNEVYGFTYSDVCYSLFYEHKSLDGIESLNRYEVVINGVSYTIQDSINYVLSCYFNDESSSDYFVEQVNCDSNCIDKLDVSYSSVNSFIYNYGDKYLSKSYFPMVSLLDYMNDSPVYSSKLDFLDSLSGANYIGIKGSLFNFDNGLTLDCNSVIGLSNILIRKFPEIENDIEKMINKLSSMNKLLKGVNLEFDRSPSFRLNYDYIKSKNNSSKEYYESVCDLITSDVKLYSASTNFGDIISATYCKSKVYSKLKLSGFTIFSITHSANYMYSIARSGIVNYVDSNDYSKRIKNKENISEYINEFRDTLGYFLKRPNIVPLFIHNIIEDEFGVQINILVAVNTNNYKSFMVDDENDINKGWGSMFLVVPLLLTGTRHYRRGNFIIFELAFQEFAIEYDVYKNLVASVDEFNDLIYIDSCSKSNDLNSCNCRLSGKDTKIVKEYKKVCYGNMKRFVKDLDRYAYFE